MDFSAHHSALLHRLNSNQKKNPLIFCYPAVVIIVYLLCGFYAGLWHPLWILFATIPIYYIASGYAYKTISANNQFNIKAKPHGISHNRAVFLYVNCCVNRSCALCKPKLVVIFAAF